MEPDVVDCLLLWAFAESRFQNLKASGIISRLRFSGAADEETKEGGVELPRVLRAAMFACRVEMACCWSLMVCLAC